jgi:hypothetical protein
MGLIYFILKFIILVINGALKLVLSKRDIDSIIPMYIINILMDNEN